VEYFTLKVIFNASVARQKFRALRTAAQSFAIESAITALAARSSRAADVIKCAAGERRKIKWKRAKRGCLSRSCLAMQQGQKIK
jgi:hypothetical protein